MGVSKNNGTPKSSILIGFSIINHPFWSTLSFGNIHIYIYNVTHLKFSTFSPWRPKFCLDLKVDLCGGFKI